MLKLVISILICQCAGIIGSLFTIRSIPTWYAFINKPTFTPPNWVFAPVWTILFTLMGIAAFLIWRKGLRTPGVKYTLSIFLLQLALNSLWSIVFFGSRSIVGGLAVIVFLWLAIVWTIKRFSAISKPAAALLIPYIAWVSFAVILNVAFEILN
ncbi:MAG TPA: tryptophan-rich sensory protein [Candidatus Omnitrophota bacterium]|nr:tryptophan-rich sensory protein [Candidatus Omnitrophota bacterium]